MAQALDMNSHGLANGKAEAAAEVIAQVLKALEVVHNPQSTNEYRQAASSYLEAAKSSPQAAEHGFLLGRDKNQPGPLRHYGLSLLEGTICYRWHTIGDERLEDLRKNILVLAKEFGSNEPLYLGNKIAQLWAELAMRIWPSTWKDMDEDLLAVWNISLPGKNIVLSVLETLSEEIFAREAAIASIRGSELSKACFDLFGPSGYTGPSSRASTAEGDQKKPGWLQKTCEFIRWALASDYGSDRDLKIALLKAISSIKAAMSWSIPCTIEHAGCVSTLCEALMARDIVIQMVG